MENRQLGGIGFLVGNGALFANGLIAHLKANTPESRKAGLGRMGSAIGWAGGAAILARYGDRPVEKQLDRLQEKLAAHLQKQGVPLNEQELRQANAETQRH